ncbi:MAG: outer membrane protein assembly factor BamB family protein [Planctomycetota bacterium]|jgi:outer membrane protein assembly factor BamB
MKSLKPIYMVLFSVTLCYAGDWPQYLGSDRNGISSETGFEINWSEEKPAKVLWRQSLGEGYAGASVSQGKVYILDRIDGERDIFRCFDLQTGDELWQYAYDDPGNFSFNGSRTSPTIHGDKAFCVGAMGTVHCFDLNTQKPVWSRDFRKDFNAEVPMWAFSQAPVIYKNLVIIAVQGVEAGVVAYHADTGKIVWKTPRLCEDYGYASPVLTTIDGVDQVIQVTPYVSPDYVEEEEEEEDEEEPVPSVPLTGKTFTVEVDGDTYTLVFKTEETVHVSGSKAGQGHEGRYWQDGEGVFIDTDILGMAGEYDGDFFGIMEMEVKQADEEDEEDEDEEDEEDEDEEDEDEEDEEDEDEGPEFEGGGIYGIDAQTGKILWNYKGFNCSFPIPPVTLLDDNRILITGAYESAATMIQVKSIDGQFQVKELFINKNIQSQIHPAIYYDNHLFMNANGNAKQNGLMCISLDGKVLWKTGRKPNLDWGGFLIADGKIFIVDGKRGDLYCVKASPQGYQELGKMKRVLKGPKLWSPVALSEGMLVIRDQKQLVCVKLKAE